MLPEITKTDNPVQLPNTNTFIQLCQLSDGTALVRATDENGTPKQDGNLLILSSEGIEFYSGIAPELGVALNADGAMRIT